MKDCDLLHYTGVSSRICKVLSDTEVEVSLDDLHQSLFLYGPAGTGKSVLAAAILAESLFSRIHPFAVRTLINGGNVPQFAKQYRFIRIPELLMQFKASYQSKYEQSETDLVDLYSQAKLLVLDDLGAEMTTNWSYQMLYLIVDNRYSEMLPTIFTSNLNLRELAERFSDERLVSRIIEMCGKDKIRKINGQSYRLNALKTPG